MCGSCGVEQVYSSVEEKKYDNSASSYHADASIIDQVNYRRECAEEQEEVKSSRRR